MTLPKNECKYSEGGYIEFLETPLNHRQIELLKIEFIFGINAEILFAFVGEALHLQEIYLTFDARKQTACVDEKPFATAFEAYVQEIHYPVNIGRHGGRRLRPVGYSFCRHSAECFAANILFEYPDVLPGFAGLYVDSHPAWLEQV
ncbi:MAG: hypothetical protein LBG96_00165 [Tannerella sp.]|jgi:hypothetical protein|nr:hypothetical protein [Tannerella sp.]